MQSAAAGKSAPTREVSWPARMYAAVEDALLAAIAIPPGATESGATTHYTLDNCLDYAKRTIPSFAERVRGRTVLDYGCGPGWQAVAMRTELGAARVHGLDIVDEWFEHGRALAAASGCAGVVTFGSTVPEGLQPDLVLSLGAFEHFADPAQELRRMAAIVRPGGHIILSWAEPWYSNGGSHFSGYTRLPVLGTPAPWLNLVFSERALLKLRSRYRPNDPAERFADISGGLNQMSVAKFERIIAASGLDIQEVRLFATKGLPLVTRVPVLRELLTSAVCCIVRRPAH